MGISKVLPCSSRDELRRLENDLFIEVYVFSKIVLDMYVKTVLIPII